MTAQKLRLGPLPKATVVKLAITLPTDLKDTLDRYAAQHSATYGEAVDGASLVPHMIQSFMARDRAFKSAPSRKKLPAQG